MSQSPNRASRRAAQRQKSPNSALPSSNRTQPLTNSASSLPELTAESMDTNGDTLSNPLPFPPNLPPMNATGISDQSENAKPEKRKDRFDKMRDDLTEQFAGLGLTVYMVNQPDGQTLLQHAESLAGKLTNVAKQNKAVENAIKKYLAGSVYTVLALEVSAIAQALMKNHGFDPMARLAERFKKSEEPEQGTDANGYIRAMAGHIPA